MFESETGKRPGPAAARRTGWDVHLAATPVGCGDAQRSPARRSALPGTFDPQAYGDEGLIDAIVEAQRMVARFEARQTRLIAELARRRPGDDPELSGIDKASATSRWAPDELGLALGLSRLAAGRRLVDAQRLTTVLTATLDAWQLGQVDAGRVRSLLELTKPLPDHLAVQVQDSVLGRAAGKTYSQFRASVRRAVLRADPEGAERRHRIARAERRVVIQPETDGMSSLWALLPAVDAESSWQMLTRLARSLGPDDVRGIDARRADILADLLTGRLSLSTSPRDDEQAGPSVVPVPPATGKPLVQIVVGLDTLTGESDLPGELVGYGPIPASVAREAAADGVWRRLVTDPVSGALLDHGRTTYRPPAALADFVRARDRTCRFPICNRRSVDCDLDHGRRWADDGGTDERNLFGLCRSHHRLKESQLWSVVAHEDGRLEWITPTGRSYSSSPANHSDLTRAPGRLTLDAEEARTQQ